MLIGGKHGIVCMEQEDNDKDFKAVSVSFVAALKACAMKKDLCKGSKIHADIQTSGLLETNPYLGNTLVSMYAKCGALAKAQQVLEELPIRDVVTWSALITGYAQQGMGKEALDCYERMQCDGLSPDAITYACILKACGITQEAERGKQIHYVIATQGLLREDVVLGNALVDMYAKCGVLDKSQQVFDDLPHRDVVSWNALIAGYAQQGQGKEALNCYDRMQSDGLSVDSITYACILKACGTTQDIERGKLIHDEIVKQGLLGKNVMLGNALVDMYAKCGVLEKAQQVFDDLPHQNVVSWNALISGYVQQGRGKEALNWYEQMQSDGLSPNSITYACILKACSITQEIESGKLIHDEIVSQGFLGETLMLGTALVDMYAKCGALGKAQEVFDELPARDFVSWSALIAGYALQGQGKEALDCYERMRSDGFSPSLITYACVLKACGIMQEIERGKLIHDEIVSQGLLGQSHELATALVDMYANCGALAKVQQVLEELRHVRI